MQTLRILTGVKYYKRSTGELGRSIGVLWDHKGYKGHEAVSVSFKAVKGYKGSSGIKRDDKVYKLV